MTIIDLGCGYDKVFESIGLDICLYNNDIRGDALKTPFRDRVADRVTLNQFLEHVDADKLIKECYRILKPDGVISIETPNTYYIFKILRILRGQPLLIHREHIQTFNGETLTHLLKNNGFRHVIVDYTTGIITSRNRFYYFFKWLILKLIPSRLKRDLLVYAVK